MKVKAIFSFDHGGPRRRGDEFEVSDLIGERLKSKGLVSIVGEDEVVSEVPGEKDDAKAAPATRRRRSTQE